MKKYSERYNVVSFFSGCGGFDYGFHNKKFNLILATDEWEDAVQSFKLNYKDVNVVKKDIRNFTDLELKNIIGNRKIDVVIGGPPCQCFTRLNNEQLIHQGKKNIEDKRRSLSSEYIKKIEYLNPEIVLMENVRDLLTRKNLKGELYREIIQNEFKKIGYTSFYQIVKMNDYGSCEKRTRVIFIASNDKKIIEILKNDKLNGFPEPSKKKLYVKDRLDKLSKFKNLENSERIEIKGETTIKRIKKIPEGGYYNDLPDDLKIKKEKDGKLVIVKRYGSYFRRLKYNGFAHTITNNPYIHPKKNRYLTNREKAVIRGFNPRFKFYGGTVSVSQQIANAVSPPFANLLGKKIYKILEEVRKR